MTHEHPHAPEGPHVDDRLDEWLDGRLDDAERRAVEHHLEHCPDCRKLRDALLAGREALRSGLADEPAPPGLEARIRAALDAEDAGAEDAVAENERVTATPRAAPAPRPAPAPPPRTSAPLPGRRLLPLAAVLALALLGAWWLMRPQPVGGNPVDAAFGQLASLEAPALPERLRVAGTADLDRRWRRADLGFPVRVIDLSAMGIALAGGDATRLAGRPAARALYRGDAGLIACWMFQGAESALPAADEIRVHRGFEFHVYRRGEATLVVWREGEVLCALAGRGDPEQVLRLATAKAMAPGAV